MKRNRVLAAIALFRLSKAALLVLAGFGLLELLRPLAAEKLQDWMRSMPLVLKYHPDRVLGNAHHLEIAAAAAFAYAALFTTEGIGLWLQKTWAEYLTIIATTSFIPFEIWEVLRRATALRIALLIANAAIVVYLVAVRWSAREDRLGRGAG